VSSCPLTGVSGTLVRIALFMIIRPCRLLELRNPSDSPPSLLPSPPPRSARLKADPKYINKNTNTNSHTNTAVDLP
jgi:hypothetical protein